MASSCRYFFIILALALVFPAIASAATYFVVGDGSGWTTGVDYQAWAQGKDFQVGDRLVFKYRVGEHTLFKVNGTSFQSCTIPPPSEALTSGDDIYHIIFLATPGRKWYICGVGEHCLSGQKLVIDVNVKFPRMAPSPAPSSKSTALPYSYDNSGNGFTLNIYFTFMVSLVVVLAIFGF